MLALSLGLLAALAWGIHDVCVRYISQRGGIISSIFTVLGFGLVFVTPVSLWFHDEAKAANAEILALLSGVVFAVAGFALYKAFAIGPVRLVAPIIGAYPILSVGWASLTGSPATPWQWLAVGIVIVGVTFVARQDTDTHEAAPAGPAAAILWSVLAGTGFAITFAVGHAATVSGGELALLAPTRIGALLTIALLALILRAPLLPPRRNIPVLAIMGALDAVALGCVIGAGQTARPEFAAVAASTFGLITVILAGLFLGEKLSRSHWIAVVAVFSAIGFLAV